MLTIDSDAHVIETPQTFSFMSAADSKYAPILVMGSGGYREMEAPSGAPRADWHAVAWVVAGIVANASLITTVGFILSCALCFALAVRGLRLAEGRPGGGLRRTGTDAATGIAIAAPVFWMFTQLLAINLPGLTASGWL